MNKMNQTQTRSPRKRLLSLILAVILMIGLLPISAFATSASVQAGEDKAATQDSEFLRIFHLDCGRKYFTVSEIEGIIDQLAENHFTHLQLAFGNDGLRFLLDDMSLTVNGEDYSSAAVTSAIKQGNTNLTSGSSGELSQSDMDAIIKYANTKGIQIIPLFNAPGHMYTAVNAMKTLGVGGKYIEISNLIDGRTSNWAVNPTDATAVAFAEALLQKYVIYFAGKGSTMFNIGADESGLDKDNYASYAKMVNGMNAIVRAAGMTTLAYNDGIYRAEFASSQPDVKFDNNIVICYWTEENSISVAEFLSKGFKILNNNGDWYYVLGDYLYKAWLSTQWSYQSALSNLQSTPVTQMMGYTGTEQPMGSILCVWCDGPSVGYTTGYGYRATTQTNQQSVYNLIKAMAENNPDYFTDKVKLSASDNATGVSVTMTGTKGQKATVEVKEITSDFTFDTEAHVSYNVTPAVNGKAYTGEGTVTLPVPGGWATEDSRIRAYIIDNGAVKLISGTLSDGKYTFQVPHFSEMGLVQLAKGAGSTENVTVAVGRTSKAYDLTGDNLPGNGTYPLGDVASYTVATAADGWKVESKAATTIVTGKQYVIGNGSQYLTLNGSTLGTTEKSSNATVWTITKSSGGYTINSGSSYLSRSSSWSGYSLSASTIPATWSWSANDGFYFTSGWDTYYLTYSTYSSGWTVTSYVYDSSTKGQPYTATEVPGGKTVTFKGVAVGNTTAVIGDTQYNITVVNEDLDNAATLPIQLWITNSSIEVTGVTTKGSEQFNDHNNGGYAYYVTAKAEAAFGEKGVALSQLVPDAVKDKSETSRDDRDATYALWKGTVLNTTTGLQKVWWTDMTKADGRVDYQYVRYYSGSWAVSSDRENWTIVTGEGSTGGASSCKEQVIAYYMQRTDVTQEVITDVVDWGNPTDKWATERPTQYGVLDFAVKYPDGTRVPDSFPEMGKTVYFHCDESDKTGVVFQDGNSNYYRRIGLINGIDTTGYEIYMITVTPTSDTPTEQLTGKNTALTTSTKIEYKGTEKVAWVDDEGNLPSQFKPNDAKFSSISGNYQYTVGGNPNIEGLEIYQRQGMLVTYYIRPVATMDSLHVHYINKNTGNEFYTYPINVKVEFGKEDKAVFNSQIGLDTPWKGPLKNGTVVNDMNVKQTVSTDLSTMPAIGAEYRYSTYTCVEVVRSDNGKDVYLYYTFTNSKTFVVDFGLPLEIAPKDMNTELSGKVNKVEVANADRLTYGTVSVKNTPADGYKVVYKLNKTIDGYETINLTYSGVNTETFKEGSVTWTAYIIPASNVYYEDSLAAFKDGTGAASGANWSIVGKATDEQKSATQALEELHKKKNVYGYDDAYNSSSMLSMGTAHKVTVTAKMLEDYNSNKDNFAWPTAQFTFKGTGFDIISLTDNTSGAIMVTVEGVTDTTYKKNFLVNNYYGYAYNEADNKWTTVPSNDSNAIYQIPVMKVNGIPYGEYKVTIGVLYNSLFDKTGNSAYNFWLDAIRIYDPMGNEYADYTKDGEGYPQYIKLHDEVKNGTATPDENTLLFIDGAEKANIQQYTNLGPNNEVYLMNGQAITFKLIGDTDKIASVQIGAKAPKGTVELQVNEEKVVENLSTATEMYYDITTLVTNDNNYQVTITNVTGNILSLTNLKITYSAKGSVSLGTLNTQEQESAVSLVRALFTAPVATFSPETFQADWGRAVRAGKRATLTVKTSADVESITVDGQAITSYTTRTQRSGWGWWSPKVTYHVFTYTITAPAQTTDYAVCAVNAEGTASEPITATLTVRPATWWNWWF